MYIVVLHAVTVFVTVCVGLRATIERWYLLEWVGSPAEALFCPRVWISFTTAICAEPIRAWIEFWCVTVWMPICQCRAIFGSIFNLYSEFFICANAARTRTRWTHWWVTIVLIWSPQWVNVYTNTWIAVWATGMLVGLTTTFLSDIFAWSIPQNPWTNGVWWKFLEHNVVDASVSTTIRLDINLQKLQELKF